MTGTFRYAALVPVLVGWALILLYLAGGFPPIVYNGQRFMSVLLLSACVLGGLLVALPRLGGPSRLLLLWLLMCAAGATLLNGAHWFAWREVALVAMVILAARLLAALRLHIGTAFDRPAMQGVVLFSFGVSLIVLQSLLLYATTLPVLQWQLVFEAFFNVRYFSNVQGWTLLLLPAAIHALKDQRGWHLIAWLAAALWWGLFYFSGSRSLLVAVLCGMLLCLWVFGPRHPWWRTVFLCAGAGLLVFLVIRGGLFLAGIEVTDSLEFTRDWWAAGGRWKIWAFVGQHAWQDLWTGPGNHLLACTDAFGVNHEHNVVMTLLAGWGLPVTLVAVGLVLWLLWRFIQTVRTPLGSTDWLAMSLVAMWGTVLTEALFSSNYLNPISHLLAALMLGWSWGIVASGSITGHAQAPAARISLPVLLLSLMVLAAALFMIAVDIHMQETLIFPGDIIRMNFGPRVWAWGSDWCP